MMPSVSDPRVHAHHPWGRLILARGALAPAAMGDDIAAAGSALAGFWGRGPRTPFDVTLDPDRLVPCAWPAAQPPRLALPSPPVRPCRTADLVHELAHLVVFVPRALLLSEGMAVASAYLLADDASYPVPGGAPALQAYALGQPGPPLRDLAEDGGAHHHLRVTGRPVRANRIAYARAGAFALHLAEEHGARRLIDVLDRLSREPGLSEEAALHDAFGSPLDALEDGWLAAREGSEAWR
jgi:hypothetical protein